MDGFLPLYSALEHLCTRTALLGSWDVPLTLHVVTDSPFLLRRGPSSRPSHPKFNSHGAFCEVSKSSDVFQCRPFGLATAGIIPSHPNTSAPGLPSDRIREFRRSRLAGD